MPRELEPSNLAGPGKAPGRMTPHLERARHLCPNHNWDGARGALLTKLSGAGWRARDYDRLFLVARGDAGAMLFQKPAISRELVRALWNTPLWLHTSRMLCAFEAPEVGIALGRATNLLVLLGAREGDRPKLLRSLASARTKKDVDAVVRQLRRTSPPVRSFPQPLAVQSEVLQVIDTYSKFVAEARVTGLIFDAFWLEAAQDKVAAFFSWKGKPRATVLVVIADGEITHIECRKAPDMELDADEAAPIVAYVLEAFRAKGCTIERARRSH